MDFTRDGLLAGLQVAGRPVGSRILEATTSATLDLSTSMTSQLVLTIADPQLELLRANALPKRTAVTWGDFDLEVAVRSTVEVAGGAGLEVTARARGIQRMKRRRGAKVWRGLSYASWLRSECRAVGLRFYGQTSPHLKQVVRAKDETSWDVAIRAARELGYIVFEATGSVYFGRPTWLVSHLPRQDVAYGASTNSPLYGFPSLRDSDDDTTRGLSGSLAIDYSVADRFRPGRGVHLTGLGAFNGTYAVQSLRMTLDGATVADVGVATPVNPEPEPPETSADKAGKPVSQVRTATYGSTPGASAAASASTQVEKFVQLALAQAGDRYIFGAEASLNDPDPDVFDCSELVQWAAHRAGAYMPDGSGAQRSYCRATGNSISVSKAQRTRGALLFGNGHVAISLGGGNAGLRTIEAANHRIGVRVLSSVGRPWIGGGLVPGMNYSGPKKKKSPVPHGAVPPGSAGA